ncbi:hypothetical protein [Asticcacaulis machinosus]|uniref:Uncharacterized protein n=1 Tax=Asticcacaulis machinosus TaxID=2984211 RepID=A0ABT5HHJ1_9CAUL|nr:hypothetical protein [Asticcacaulis machinosus]MDC7675712.1 hypothetical protein [Asticcacaulis machinosus]
MGRIIRLTVTAGIAVLFVYLCEIGYLPSSRSYGDPHILPPLFSALLWGLLIAAVICFGWFPYDTKTTAEPVRETSSGLTDYGVEAYAAQYGAIDKDPYISGRIVMVVIILTYAFVSAFIPDYDLADEVPLNRGILLVLSGLSGGYWLYRHILRRNLMATVQNAAITLALFSGFYALYVFDIFAMTIERDPYEFDMIALYAAAALGISAGLIAAGTPPSASRPPPHLRQKAR